MLKYLVIISMLISFSACDSETKRTTETTDKTGEVTTPEPSVPSSGNTSSANQDWSGCYDMTIEKDSAHMKLTRTASGYEGALTYKRFEKDSNNGTVSLIEDEKYLKGWYRFQSEGMQTVREVYFRKSGSKLEEGYGEITMIGDTVLYKYPATLNFENKHPFIKTNCK